MNEADTETTLRAFAAAAVLVGARLAQHEKCEDGASLVPAFPVEDTWEEWVATIIELLRPLGEEGALISHALLCILEGAEDWIGYQMVAELNRILGPMIESRKDEDGRTCRPGSGSEEDVAAIRELLDVTQRWSLQEGGSL